MQATGASVPPMPRHARRIVGVDGRGCHHALAQLHAAAVLEIDSGNQQQAYKEPFVDGVSLVRASRSSAIRKARPNALKIVSA